MCAQENSNQKLEIETLKNSLKDLEEKLKEKQSGDEELITTMKNLSGVILSKKKWNGIDNDTRKKLNQLFGDNMGSVIDLYEQKLEFNQREKTKYKNSLKETKDSLIGILDQLVDTDKGDLKILSQLQKNEARDALLMLEASQSSIQDRIDNSKSWIKELQKEMINLSCDSESPISKIQQSPTKVYDEELYKSIENKNDTKISQLEEEIKNLRDDRSLLQKTLSELKSVCEGSDFVVYMECQASALEEFLREPEHLADFEITF